MPQAAQEKKFLDKDIFFLVKTVSKEIPSEKFSWTRRRICDNYYTYKTEQNENISDYKNRRKMKISPET